MTSIKLLNRELPLKIEWLRTFLAVVDSGGITRASKEIHLSQPAVSTHVKDLEQNLGGPLLDHVGGKLRLTQAGEIVAREARRILECVHDLHLAVSEGEGTVQGMVSVGASTTPGNYLLPDLLARFERRYPRARASLSIGNSAAIVERISSNEVDIGVIGFDPDPDKFTSWPVAEDTIVAIVSPQHPLARERRMTRERLLRERFLLREATSATRRLSEAWMARLDLRPAVMELGCPETVKRAVAAGLGVGLLPRMAVAWELQQRRLIVVRLPNLPIRRRLYAVHHRKKHVPNAVHAFLEILRRNPASRGSRP